MRLYLRLAWRNIWRHRRRTVIVVTAMALSMMFMMLYDGLVAGFDQAIYANAIKVLGGNVQVHASGYQQKASELPLLAVAQDEAVVKAAAALPQVQTASRRINTGGMATNREGAFSVSIVGIEPEQEQTFSLIAKNVTAGRFLTGADQDVALIGKGLADEMSLKTGDRFTLVGKSLHDQMRQRTMTVGGIYDVGMPDIEKRTLYISLGEAQALYGLEGQSTEVMITLNQLGQEPAVMAALKSSIGNNDMSSWRENFPEMTNALESKGKVMGIFSFIILIIVGIGIMNLLLMAVFERTREIGLLGALGMKPRQISFLFLLEGGFMGLVGLAAGIVLGLAAAAAFRQVGFDYSKFASMTSYTALISGRIYPTLGLENLLQHSLAVLVISVLAAFYPAREASLSEPAEALHYV